MENPLISIVIPTKNGISTIQQCLDAIFEQTLIDQCEVIVIDSGSNDGTLEIANKYPVRLYPIEPETFNHGATRNYGVSLAQGEFVVMTVQDAVPPNDQWLATMLSHFKNKEVVGVCGQQYVPWHKDKNPFEWHRPVSLPQSRTIQFKTTTDFTNLSPQQQREACGWDDVNAMYRKESLFTHPFQHVKFGEDLIWAKEMILQGHALVYEPNAQVQHYHQVSYSQQMSRKKIEILNDYIELGLQANKINILKSILINAYRMLKWQIPFKWYGYQLTKEMAYNKAVEQTATIIKHSSKEEIKSKYF